MYKLSHNSLLLLKTASALQKVPKDIMKSSKWPEPWTALCWKKMRGGVGIIGQAQNSALRAWVGLAVSGSAASALSSA